MELAVLGWPPDGPQLDLDHERFAYAGKFVMSSTGKAVCREDGELVAAVAFSADRTDADTLWLRYVTVRADRRGEGIGPRLTDGVARRALDRDVERVAIAVNNPYAYEALYRAGFEFTGETTGIAELVLERPGDPRDDGRTGRYRDGLARFAGRADLSDDERAFVDDKRDTGPPETLDASRRL